MNTSQPPEKRQWTEDYVLYCWPGIPSREECIRLALEYAGIPYTVHTSSVPAVLTKLGHPPHFIPPALQLPSGRVLSETATILAHIAPRCGLAGARGNALDTSSPAARAALHALSDDALIAAEDERSIVNQLTAAVLNLQNETHNVHHPISTTLYYEDQKPAAAHAAQVFRQARLPHVLAHFESVLAGNKAGSETCLVGVQTTMADVVLFQVVDGLLFAFPKRLTQLKASGKYDKVFALYERIKGEKGIKEYLASGRRRFFSLGLGIFRHYEELDGEEEDM